MKAQIGTVEDLNRANTFFEPKLDGIRAICYVNEGLRLYSSNRRDITSEYPEFQFRDAIHAKSAVLDGEIVALDPASNPRFSLWQHGQADVYIVFDILMLDEKDLTNLPLLERKRILETVLKHGPHIENCVYTTHGQVLWQEMLKREMEGVIAKKVDSQYHPGSRSSQWIKIKAYKTLEAIIIGYTSSKRSISSLLLGLYQGEKLVYVGKVGTGFTDLFLEGLHAQLNVLRVKEQVSLEYAEKGAVQWVRPELVCEVKYLEFTDAGKLRAPVFKRLRPDKYPEEITLQQQGITK